MFVQNALAWECLTDLGSRLDAYLADASTATVCGARSEKIDANTPILAYTAYSSSKRLGEQLIEASHTPSCILRIGGVFGANGPAHLWFNRAITGEISGTRPKQSVSCDSLRNCVYVKDVAECIVFVLPQRLDRFHLIAFLEVISISEMFKVIYKTFLPHWQPTIIEGQEAMSKVIDPSNYLLRARAFC